MPLQPLDGDWHVVKADSFWLSKHSEAKLLAQAQWEPPGGVAAAYVSNWDVGYKERVKTPATSADTVEVAESIEHIWSRPMQRVVKQSKPDQSAVALSPGLPLASAAGVSYVLLQTILFPPVYDVQ